MSLLSTMISNLFNGVSQQPPELRDPSQATAQLNAVSSPAYGLRKRPGTTHVAKIGAEALNPLVHFIDRDRNEQYAVVASDGAISVFDVQTGGQVPVTTPHGLDYLRCANPQEDLRLVSVADYTFVVNTKRPVQMSASTVDNTDQLAGTVSFPIPVLQYPIVVPTDPSLTPGAGGTSNTPSLPNYGGGGGYPGGGGTGSSGTPESPWPDTPPDPTNDTGNSGGGTTDPGTGTGGSTGGTGGGTGGTGGGTGGTGGGTGTPPTPTQPAVTQLKPNEDGSWPDVQSANYSFLLPDDATLMPPSVGDYRAVIEVLNANKFWELQDKVLVLYRPRVCLKVKAGGPGLGRFFTADTLFPEPGMTYQMVTNGLASENKFRAIPNYFRASPYYDGVNQSFPQLVWPGAKTDSEIMALLAATPRAAVLYKSSFGTDPSQITVRDPLAFDATYLFLLEEIETGAKSVQELNVRVSIMGMMGADGAVGSNGDLSLLAGNANANYTQGGFLYSTESMSFRDSFLGFTTEFNRMVLWDTYSMSRGIPSASGLRISGNAAGIPYASGPGSQMNNLPMDLFYPGRALTYDPPMAYKLFPKAGLTENMLGAYHSVYEPYYGTVGLVRPYTIPPL